MKKRIFSFTLALLLLGTAASAATPGTQCARSDCAVSSNGSFICSSMPGTRLSNSNIMNILNSFPTRSNSSPSNVSVKANVTDTSCGTGTACAGTDTCTQKDCSQNLYGSGCTTANLSNQGIYTFLRQYLDSCNCDASLIRFLCPTASPSVPDTPKAPETSPPPAASQTPEAPATEPPATTQPSNQADNLSYEQQVVALVNEQRAANGLAPLTLNTELSNVARAKSQDMHDNHYFDHQSPTYGSPSDMLHSFGISYRSAGENIAMGYATPQAVMTGWMNSTGHRANILNASYTQIGVGYVADGNYWTQEFIG